MENLGWLYVAAALVALVALAAANIAWGIKEACDDTFSISVTWPQVVIFAIFILLSGEATTNLLLKEVDSSTFFPQILLEIMLCVLVAVSFRFLGKEIGTHLGGSKNGPRG
ncbi:MAG TPA: hypothetical protein VMQ44_03035 [Candidatus Saccharimonadales bacterium]|nr:hypothetical protein [Candidatus Saccharimonadales bacterium]